MAHFRTIRQRRHRARRGQVSAVATVLGLLLVVIFLSSFVLEQIPSQMAQLEFDHVSQVQNQLSRLQATILAQAENPALHLNLVSPVTLGSSSVPPFSQPSSGSISPEATTSSAVSWFALAVATYSPPNWNQGASCANGNGSICSSNGNLNFYNFTGVNHTTLNLKVTGGNNGMVYNFSGNNDTINLVWSGKDTTFIQFIVNGSDNVVNYQKGGSDNNTPIVNFFFYGERNLFTFNPSGSHSALGGMQISVVFVGAIPPNANQCPFSNASLTNRVGTLSPGGSHLHMNVTWWNSVGYVTPVHTQAYPGGVIPTETLSWRNMSAGFVPCAFSQISSTSYGSIHSGGIDVHLNNRYSPGADVVYEGGAVLLAQVGGSALMVSPPEINVTRTAGGLTGSVVIINLLANMSAQGGIQTAGVTSLVTQVNTVTLSYGTSHTFLATPYFYNITTQYPTAWIQYMNANPLIFPNGPSCTSNVPILAPYTCAHPPPGLAVTISGALTVQTLTITTISVAASIS